MGMYKIRFRKEKQFRELSLPQKSNDRKYFTHWKPIIHLQISNDIESWYVVIGAEGILRCSTKSLLLLIINESTIRTIHTYD